MIWDKVVICLIKFKNMNSKFMRTRRLSMEMRKCLSMITWEMEEKWFRIMLREEMINTFTNDYFENSLQHIVSQK